MSFANELKGELIELQHKKNCCKKAFLLGLLINTQIISDKQLCADFLCENIAIKTKELLKSLYSVQSSYETITKPGKTYYRIIFNSPSILNLLKALDSDPDSTISEIVSFRCSSCEQAFLRGVFISAGKLNDPQKSYHLEFSIYGSNLARASKMYRFLSFSGFVPKIINRKNSTGLYYKNNVIISDVLYFVGAIKLSFDYTDLVIKKEVRNKENRATNCVTRNIQKAVDASQKHVMAINKLMQNHKFDALPEELKETALLRINNKELKLSELAALHTPPISKSGLNHRLDKICKEAELVDNN